MDVLAELERALFARDEPALTKAIQTIRDARGPVWLEAAVILIILREALK